MTKTCYDLNSFLCPLARNRSITYSCVKFKKFLRIRAHLSAVYHVHPKFLLSLTWKFNWLRAASGYLSYVDFLNNSVLIPSWLYDIIVIDSLFVTHMFDIYHCIILDLNIWHQSSRYPTNWIRKLTYVFYGVFHTVVRVSVRVRVVYRLSTFIRQ